MVHACVRDGGLDRLGMLGHFRALPAFPRGQGKGAAAAATVFECFCQGEGGGGEGGEGKVS